MSDVLAGTQQEPEFEALSSRSADGRFLPGVSGNPAGRPNRRDILADVLDAVLMEPSTVDDKKSRLEVIVRMAVALAEKGNLKAIEYLWDRREGRPALTVYTKNDREGEWLDLLAGMGLGKLNDPGAD